MQTQTGTSLETAAQLLEAGAIVAIPTETVYGLAGNALDPAAVTKIFSIKNRPAFNPLIVHLHSVGEMEKYAAEVPALIKRLAEKFSPGPLTYVLPKKDVVPDLVTAGGDTVALRIPAHPLTRALLERLPFPLAAPSANPFGYISPVTAAHVEQQLGGKIPYILDGGACEVGLESTVVTVQENKLIVLRLGGVAIEELEKVAGKSVLQLNRSSNPQSPGQLKSHYAPKHRLLLGDLETLIEKHSEKKIGLLSFREKFDHAAIEKQRQLSPSGDLDEAARNLFTALRELDAADIDLILAEKLPAEGLGRAVNDRLLRAAAE